MFLPNLHRLCKLPSAASMVFCCERRQWASCSAQHLLPPLHLLIALLTTHFQQGAWLEGARATHPGSPGAGWKTTAPAAPQASKAEAGDGAEGEGRAGEGAHKHRAGEAAGARAHPAWEGGAAEAAGAVTLWAGKALVLEAALWPWGEVRRMEGGDLGRRGRGRGS